MADSKSEVEALMNDAVGVEFANRMLREHGKFLLYGAAMKQSGEIVSIAAHDGREQPPSRNLIDLLKDGLKQAAAAGIYRATAVFYDVRVTPPGNELKTDTIAVALDYQDDYSVIVYVPYQIEEGVVVYGELFAQAGETVFLHREPSQARLRDGLKSIRLIAHAPFSCMPKGL